MESHDLVFYTKHYLVKGRWLMWIADAMRGNADDLQQKPIIDRIHANLPVITQAVEAREQMELGSHAHAGSDLGGATAALTDKLAANLYYRLDTTFDTGADDAHSALAGEARDAAFPAGLGDHVHSTLQERYTFNKRVVSALQNERFLPLIKAQGLQPTIDKLAARNEDLMNASKRSAPPTGAEVDRLERRAQQGLLDIVFFTLVHYPWQDAEQVQLREKILEPMRLAYRKLHAVYAERARKAKEKAEQCADDKKKEKDENKNAADQDAANQSTDAANQGAANQTPEVDDGPPPTGTPAELRQELDAQGVPELSVAK